MDKIILAFYVNVKNLDPRDISEYFIKLKDNVYVNDDILNYFIAVYDGESRIECLNPKLVSEDEYNKVKELLEKTENAYKDFINKNTK
jgi:hypothetical protein